MIVITKMEKDLDRMAGLCREAPLVPEFTHDGQSTSASLPAINRDIWRVVDQLEL
jgi:hypothetical protein